jgi:hypothetical protein
MTVTEPLGGLVESQTRVFRVGYLWEGFARKKIGWQPWKGAPFEMVEMHTRPWLQGNAS